MRVSLLSKFEVENHTPHPLVGMQIAVQFIKKNVPFVPHYPQNKLNTPCLVKAKHLN